MRNSKVGTPIHHPVTACFFLSHKRYSHISCLGMNHKLKIDIETKIYLISCPRYDLPHSADFKKYIFLLIVWYSVTEKIHEI